MNNQNLENPNYVAGCNLINEQRNVYAICDECGEEIYYGEEYYEIGNNKYCTCCVELKEAYD